MFARKIRQKIPKNCFKSYSACTSLFTWRLAPFFLVFEGSSVDTITEADRNSNYKVLCAEMNIYSESGT